MRIAGLYVALAVAALAVRADDPVDYQRQIKPILQARCLACHGALKQEGSLRLDTAAQAIRGGDSGSVIQPGDAAASLLVERVSAQDESERMPPEGEPLTAAQVDLIKRWIAQGATAPPGEKPEEDPRDHWSFRVPQRPAIPAVNKSGWVRNPIDAFVLARLESRQLSPQRPADPRTLVRRLYLDLIGLPPTLDEQEAFVADPTPEALGAIVDRLLESQQYGERWGRHFMDIWRYSDWWGLGAEVRNSQKHIWHWRDWIIESLNADTGYDEMLREMIAADELYPNDLGRLRATGYLARQYFKFNRTSWLDETIEHTSKAFLGLTFNCGKCHDHKYDPFSQREYYQLRAIFEPYQIRTEMIPGQVDFEQNGIPRAFDCNLDAPTYLHLRGDDRNPDKTQLLPPRIPAFLADGGFEVTPIRLPADAAQPGLREYVLDNHLQGAERVLAEARAELERARSSDEGSVELAQASLALAEKKLAAAELEPVSIRARSAAQRAAAEGVDAAKLVELAKVASQAERGAAVARADMEVARAELELKKAPADKKSPAEKKLADARSALDKARQARAGDSDQFAPLRGALKTLESNLETEESRGKPFPITSTGRRTALANWLASPSNPLTARVVVNHVWTRHMGRPIVPTIFDFGRKGTPPTHPELLDWLAVELMEHDWSLKHLHRLVVTSQTYQMSSSSRWDDARHGPSAPRSPEADPDNRWYWRMNPGRMESQIVRDSLLFLAGELDMTLGGPSIPVKDESSRRRSLYFVHSNNDQQKFLAMFDDAKVQECYRRSESVVPQQALALENSQLAHRSAAKISEQLAARGTDSSEDAFIRAAFLVTLASEPTPEELAACRQAMADLAGLQPDGDAVAGRARRRAQLVHALLNHNDFITIR